MHLVVLVHLLEDLVGHKLLDLVEGHLNLEII